MARRRAEKPDYVALVEAIHAEAGSVEDWAARILDLTEAHLARESHCGAALVLNRPSGKKVEWIQARGFLASLNEPAIVTTAQMTDDDYHRFWQPRQRVLKASRMFRSDPREMQQMYAHSRANGVEDMIGLLGHPRHDATSVWYFACSSRDKLDPARRDALHRLRLHFESAVRLRLLGREDAIAVLSPKGELLHLDAPKNDVVAPSTTRHVRDVEALRTARGRAEPDQALAAWTAMVEGRWSLVERVDTDGKRFYLAFENPLAARPHRMLAPLEAMVVEQVLSGQRGKEVAYALGISEPQVSRTLSNAALKLGFRSRVDLLRAGAHILRRSAPASLESRLTNAEKDVLELVRQGYSNESIAELRGRSDATVANQVAAIMRKTGIGHRRGLMVMPQVLPSRSTLPLPSK